MRDAYTGPGIDTHALIEYAKRRDEVTIVHTHPLTAPCDDNCFHIKVEGRTR